MPRLLTSRSLNESPPPRPSRCSEDEDDDASGERIAAMPTSTVPPVVLSEGGPAKSSDDAEPLDEFRLSLPALVRNNKEEPEAVGTLV